MQAPYSIFASVGNSTQPFDRFVEMVDEATRRTGRRALVQIGSASRRPHNADAVDFVTRSEFEELMRAAEHAIVHAGAGSVMMAVQFGKIPIVVPRRKELGEHVNNHQFELASELSRMGWCHVVSNVDELIECLEAPTAAVPLDGDVTNQRMRELVTEFIG